MLKVMIVDDEPTTRQGLETIIPWEEFGFEVIGTAENGVEAIKEYQKFTPNVMIVDMKMPGMSGIELIEKIQEMDPFIEFIILSGHAEFEFARKALRYNVRGYLLKPVDEDELIPLLEELKGDFKKDIELSKVKERLNEENKERVIQAILLGEYQVELFYYFKWNNYRILLIQVVSNGSPLEVIKKRLKDYFEKDNKGFVFTKGSHIGILLNADLDENNHLNNMYTEIDKNIQTKFIVSISQPFQKVTELPNSLHLASDLIEKQFFFEDGIVLHADTKPIIKGEKWSSQDEITQFQLSEVVDQLIYAIEIGELQVIERICMAVGKYMVDKEYSEKTIKDKYINIVTALIKKLIYNHKDIQVAVSSILSKVYEIEKQSKLQNLFFFVTSLLKEIAEHIDSSRTDILVKKMIYLIEQNYHKNIKLETLSKVLNYNKAYLGQLFKADTGEYFNTYLDKVRIEKAKKLLIEGLKVYQVAELVGYSNVDYFHSKFKKYEKISPSAYIKKVNQ